MKVGTKRGDNGGKEEEECNGRMKLIYLRET